MFSESQIDFYCKNGETPGLINEDSDKVIPQTHYVSEAPWPYPILKVYIRYV